jgi:hypothetical protein
VDWRLLPILGALYSVALIDRTNMSNAKVAGMDKELALDLENRYNIALLVFFIPVRFPCRCWRQLLGIKANLLKYSISSSSFLVTWSFVALAPPNGWGLLRFAGVLL